LAKCKILDESVDLMNHSVHEAHFAFCQSSPPNKYSFSSFQDRATMISSSDL